MKSKSKEIPTLASYLPKLHKKIDRNYTASFGDNRFTLREYMCLFATAGKLFRLMMVDSPRKVPDDSLDVVGYMEIFWESFAKRTGARPKIRNELYR